MPSEITPDYIRGLKDAGKAVQGAIWGAEAMFEAEEEVSYSPREREVPVPNPDGWNRYRVTYQYGFGRTFRKKERYHDTVSLLDALTIEFPGATYVHAVIHHGEYLDAMLEVGDVEYKAVHVSKVGVT